MVWNCHDLINGFCCNGEIDNLAFGICVDRSNYIPAAGNFEVISSVSDECIYLDNNDEFDRICFSYPRSSSTLAFFADYEDEPVCSYPLSPSVCEFEAAHLGFSFHSRSTDRTMNHNTFVNPNLINSSSPGRSVTFTRFSTTWRVSVGEYCQFEPSYSAFDSVNLLPADPWADEKPISTRLNKLEPLSARMRLRTS
ncbi:MAG: hypothetical protein ABH859_07095 [Pseudomonadota bacterium]